jgi:hypothetical protein
MGRSVVLAAVVVADDNDALMTMGSGTEWFAPSFCCWCWSPSMPVFMNRKDTKRKDEHVRKTSQVL